MAATKGELTRQAILEAAIERFGRDGFRATSVADIARDADVGGTVAYTYFPNKEALFLAALDEDAAAVIQTGLSVIDDPHSPDWRTGLVFTLMNAVDEHPLAKRVLAGLEPDVTDRVLEIPALEELRKACAELLRAGQRDGSVRADIDPVSMGNGIVSVMLSLLMSVVQVGRNVALAYGADVAALISAALDTAPVRSSSATSPQVT